MFIHKGFSYASLTKTSLSQQKACVLQAVCVQSIAKLASYCPHMLLQSSFYPRKYFFFYFGGHKKAFETKLPMSISLWLVTVSA